MKNNLRAFVCVLAAAFFFGINPSFGQCATPAPDFQLNDVKGNTVTLSSYKGQQPVLILFWTTWCPFCRTELKEMDRRYDQLKKSGIEVLAINVGESANKVDAYIENRAVNYSVLLDEDTAVADKYQLVGVPTYVLVDKDGNVVTKANGYPENKIKDISCQ